MTAFKFILQIFPQERMILKNNRGCEQCVNIIKPLQLVSCCGQSIIHLCYCIILISRDAQDKSSSHWEERLPSNHSHKRGLTAVNRGAALFSVFVYQIVSLKSSGNSALLDILYIKDETMQKVPVGQAKKLLHCYWKYTHVQ